jgi:hypothetical protein
VYEEFDESGRSEKFVRIVTSGRKWSLPTPKGNGRDDMYYVYLLNGFYLKLYSKFIKMV